MYEPERNGSKLLNSIERTCERLDIGKTTCYELIKARRLEVVKMGSKSLITETSIHSLISQLTAAAQGEAA